MTEPFDPQTARRGIDSLIVAYGRWTEFREPPPLRRRRAREAIEAEAFTGGVLIVEVVRWVRAVDEYLSEARRRDNEGLAGFTAALTEDPQARGTLDGIAHAADKSLHRLIDLRRVVHAPMIIHGARYADGSEVQRNDPQYIWPDLSQLPPRKNERDRDREKARGYAEHLARREIDPVLARAVEFLRRHRP